MVVGMCGYGCVGFSGRGQRGNKSRGKIFFFPCLVDQGKKKTYSAIHNNIVLALFFFLTVY
jgi:hypothetical protein